MSQMLIQQETLVSIADAIRAKTGSTNPIPVTDMAAQIAAITGGGGSGESVTTLLAEQTVEFNESGEASREAATPLVEGKTYTVVWNGTEYECEAFGVSPEEGVTFPAIGNTTVAGGEDNGMPFVIMYMSAEFAGTDQYGFISMDGSTSATVAIYQQASSGGSVEGIVYVTFMNGDVELCKTACMVGDCSIDPVETAKIATPTKDPTESTVYTYAGGWSLTEGGEADVMALVDVSEDRTVYAVYAESVREYTINFYDDDGTTLLESVQVGYGTVPSMTYTPEKDDYMLTGWTPELVAVTGDADYVAVWESTLAVLASGTCGAAANWMLTDDGTLTIYGSGTMNAYSFNSTNGSTAPWATYRSSIKSVVIKDGVTSIGSYSFCKHTSLTSITIADSVTSIGSTAFAGTSITSIHFPATITSIDMYTCQNCTLLTDVTLPNNCYSIKAHAFNGCSALKNITIPASVSLMETSVFANTGLTSATFEDTTTWTYDTGKVSATKYPLSSSDLANTSTAANYLCSKYDDQYWRKT